MKNLEIHSWARLDRAAASCHPGPNSNGLNLSTERVSAWLVGIFTRYAMKHAS